MNKKTLHYQNGPLKDLNRLLEDMDGNFLNHLDRIGKAISCLLREAHELVSKIYCNVWYQISYAQLKLKLIQYKSKL